MEIILAVVAFGIAVLGLAVGVLFNKRSLRGSCSDLESCTICEGKAAKCESNIQPSEFL